MSGTKYYFRVGEKSGLLSDIAHFSSPKTSVDDEVQIAYVADAGVGDNHGPYSGSASHISIPRKYGYTQGGKYGLGCYS